jgi:hypothetical protein
MPMPPYPVLCYQPGCGKPACFKIAATWSDGHTRELKTYGLVCADCLVAWYRRALARQKVCRLARGETLEPPGIFEISHGRRDRQLVRRTDLERESYSADPPDPISPT